MKKILIFILLANIALFAQTTYTYKNTTWLIKDDIRVSIETKQPINGICKEYYWTGTLRKIISFKDGKENGIGKFYNKNGKLYAEYEYSDGRRHGIAKYYSENGKVDGEIPYKNGKMEKCMVFGNCMGKLES